MDMDDDAPKKCVKSKDISKQSFLQLAKKFGSEKQQSSGLTTFLNYRFTNDVIETTNEIWQSYDFIELIGEGGFGKVYSAVKVKNY